MTHPLRTLTIITVVVLLYYMTLQQRGKPFIKGMIPWNKGIKSDPLSICKMRDKIIEQYRNGRNPWNKGKKTGLIPKTAFKDGHHLGLKPRIEYKCDYCKKTILVEAWKFQAYDHHFCSKTCNAHFRTGEISANWKGGIKTERQKERDCIEYKIWRKAVFARDNYTCQKCHQIGGNIHAHHIKPFNDYPKLRMDINNGITFCAKCHRHTHTILSSNKKITKMANFRQTN
jgi:hypothetical protein